MKYASLIIAGALVAAACPAAAAAKSCPHGQIFRVSKGVCMNKAKALKEGVVLHGGAKVAHAAHAAKATPDPDLSDAARDKGAARDNGAAPQPEETAAATAPEAGTSVVEKSAAAAPSPALGFAAPLQETASRAAISPFGGLSFDGLTR